MIKTLLFSKAVICLLWILKNFLKSIEAPQMGVQTTLNRSACP